ncbi:hypothetical protein ACFU9F_32695 [Streptomyces zhihengii]|uniref:phosphoketolase family protein n=1 Tax=Streptomyces zhihengii TaxID=1818004 RepID=UPI0036B09340
MAGVRLPPDANTLLVNVERPFRDTGRINLVVAGMHSAAQWLGLDEARRHCAAGAPVWPWASTGAGKDAPDVFLACTGGIPTVETPRPPRNCCAGTCRTRASGS